MQTRVDDRIDLLSLFPPMEGELDQIHGRIGNGKTLVATDMVLHWLKKGYVVYTNYPIKWDGYDQRKDKGIVLRNFLLFRKRFYSFPAGNLRTIKIDDSFADNLEKINNAIVVLDEGHVAFDSYEMAKMSMQKRASILHTRHYNRRIVVVSQRPTAIHAVVRENVNRFYRCEKIATWPFLLFRISETQDLDADGRPDYEQKVGVRLMIPSKELLSAYNTRYLGDGMNPSQPTYIEAYDVNFPSRLGLLFKGKKARALARA